MSPHRLSLGAQSLDRPRQGELGSSEPLDEVAAPRDAERLELCELGVTAENPPGIPSATDVLAGEDAVALEQELGERSAARGRVGLAAHQGVS